MIAHNEVVLTGELDDHSMLYVLTAADAARAWSPARDKVSSGGGPGSARLFGGGSCADVDVVGS